MLILQLKVIFSELEIQLQQTVQNAYKRQGQLAKQKFQTGNKREMKRTATLQKLSISALVIPKPIINKKLQTITKTISQKNITKQQSLIRQTKLRNSKSQFSPAFTISKQNPYENFVKQMAIVLPSPIEKFYEFMQISPFNRNNHHLQVIEHFIKQYKFFKNHPVELLFEISKKIKIEYKKNIDHKMIVIIESGECYYHKQYFTKGNAFGRKELKPEDILCQPETKFFVLNRHQYQFLVSSYLDQEKQKYKVFLMNLNIFKMFTKRAFERFIENMTLTFLTPGENLYQFGDEVTHLFVVYKGKASRKVIVEIDKINKIPLLKYSKIIKILSKSYEHKIEFESEDLIGVAQLIDHIETRKQNIKIQQDSIVLGLDKNIFQQNLDQYIVDRLRKQNMKKYPVTYDKLCEKFQKEKTSLRNQQIRKIEALKGTITHNISEKKTEKINSIIKKYQENIKKSESRNLLQCKIQERSVQRQ